MNMIVRTALSGAIKALAGKEMWSKVTDTVKGLADQDLTGEEKRSLAITAVKESGWTLASWVLNLAIEIAVALLIKTATDLAGGGD